MEMMITGRPIECQVSLIGIEIRIIVEVLLNQVSMPINLLIMKLVPHWVKPPCMDLTKRTRLGDKLPRICGLIGLDDQCSIFCVPSKKTWGRKSPVSWEASLTNLGRPPYGGFVRPAGGVTRMDR